MSSVPFIHNHSSTILGALILSVALVLSQLPRVNLKAHNHLTLIGKATIKKKKKKEKENNKCWGECGEKEPLSTVGRNVKWCSKHLKTELSYNPDIPLLRIYPQEPKAGYWTDICTLMFTAALFTQPKCECNPSIHPWMTGRNSDMCYNTKDPWGHSAELNMPVTKWLILYDSTDVQYLGYTNSQRQKVEWWLPGSGGGEMRVSV